MNHKLWLIYITHLVLSKNTSRKSISFFHMGNFSKIFCVVNFPVMVYSTKGHLCTCETLKDDATFALVRFLCTQSTHGFLIVFLYEIKFQLSLKYFRAKMWHAVNCMIDFTPTHSDKLSLIAISYLQYQNITSDFLYHLFSI